MRKDWDLSPLFDSRTPEAERQAAMLWEYARECPLVHEAIAAHRDLHDSDDATTLKPFRWREFSLHHTWPFFPNASATFRFVTEAGAAKQKEYAAWKSACDQWDNRESDLRERRHAWTQAFAARLNGRLPPPFDKLALHEDRLGVDLYCKPWLALPEKTRKRLTQYMVAPAAVSMGSKRDLNLLVEDIASKPPAKNPRNAPQLMREPIPLIATEHADMFIMCLRYGGAFTRKKQLEDFARLLDRRRAARKQANLTGQQTHATDALSNLAVMRVLHHFRRNEARITLNLPVFFERHFGEKDFVREASRATLAALEKFRELFPAETRTPLHYSPAR